MQYLYRVTCNVSILSNVSILTVWYLYILNTSPHQCYLYHFNITDKTFHSSFLLSLLMQCCGLLQYSYSLLKSSLNVSTNVCHNVALETFWWLLAQHISMTQTSKASIKSTDSTWVNSISVVNNTSATKTLGQIRKRISFKEISSIGSIMQSVADRQNIVLPVWRFTITPTKQTWDNLLQNVVTVITI